MSDKKKPFDRAAHCRKIASKGGRTTVARYGREHMSQIGRAGFETTTQRYFRSETEHKSWLARMGAFVYWKSTALPMKVDKFGHNIFPSERPPHPSQKDFTEF